MRKFFDYNWLKDVTIGTTGTIIGIILTFGITYYLDNKNQRSMADKTVMLTLHNLDAAIDNMESLINEMQQHDSIYARAMSLMPDSIGIMGNDSLQMIINNFGSYRIHITDNSTERIFSSSFEVWQYLDDAKVVGRIGNCYSILSSCDKEYNRIADLKQKTFQSYIEGGMPDDYPTTEAAAEALLRRSDVRYILHMHNSSITLLSTLINIARQLNERNKEVLSITQHELDEIGNLLDQQPSELITNN